MNPLNCTGTIHGLPALLIVAIFGFTAWRFTKAKDPVVKVIGLIIAYIAKGGHDEQEANQPGLQRSGVLGGRTADQPATNEEGGAGAASTATGDGETL